MPLRASTSDPLSLTCTLLLLLFVTPSASTQVPTRPSTPASATSTITQATVPAYDVMTIKRNTTGSRRSAIGSGNDRFSANNASLKAILAEAFDLDEALISGLPSSFESNRFDIEAKVSNPDRDALEKMTPDQQKKMLLPLLTERFHLKTHTETRILPIYELVVSKSGLKCKLSADQKTTNGSMNVNGAHIDGEAVTMEAFAKTLSTRADHTVRNQTGLTGNFDLKLEWSNQNAPESDGASALPTFFTAIQEQLGLKLQPAKGPVETLVVDHAEMPGEN